MRRKGFSAGWWWGRAFSPSGVGDGSEKKRSSDPQQGVSRGGCTGSAVLVCIIPFSSRSLLLCLCCNVLLLCVLLAGRARCWLANCAGRVLHGSHCNALLSHYPLQERSPPPPTPHIHKHTHTLPSSIPALPSLHSLLLAALPFFLPPSSHTHTQSGVNRTPPALSEQMGAAEDSRLVCHSPHFALTSPAAQPLPFSLILRAGLIDTIATTPLFKAFVFCK